MTDFHELYRRYAGDVHRFAVFLSDDPAMADDITSETFLRAWSSNEPIRETTVKAYLFTIARNVYRHELRRRGRHVQLDDSLPSTGPGQEEHADQRSALATVVRALVRLPAADRAALLMRAQDAMPYEEIAQALRLSVSAVKVRVHRARTKLLAALPKESQS